MHHGGQFASGDVAFQEVARMKLADLADADQRHAYGVSRWGEAGFLR